jgi:hypothetical protein
VPEIAWNRADHPILLVLARRLLCGCPPGFSNQRRLIIAPSDLVDKCHLFLHPVIVGGGKPAFKA